jgi:putative phosphoesterase
MRVAAIYDIHANLPALEAVLQDIRRAQVDLIVVGGDVLPGPMPNETISSLLNLDIPVQFIQGNGDRVVLAEMRGTESSDVPEKFREGVRWVARQLHPEHERLLAGWPKTCRLEIRGLGEVLFCHATPRSDTEMFTRLTPEDRLLPVFEGINVPVVVCGHTHMQFDRMIGSIRVVNAGSVGMPFGEPVPIGSYLDLTFSFGVRSTISRKPLSAYETPSIHKHKSLPQGMSCNLHPRKKHSKRLPESN